MVKIFSHSLVSYSRLVWFGFINHCRLFNAKFCLYIKYDLQTLFVNNIWGYPRGVMVKAMDCGIVVRKFVLQSRYYIHFRANTLGKGMNPLILPAMG